MKKFLFLMVLMSGFAAQASYKIYIRTCNQVARSYCETTKEYGLGYGLAVFQNKKSYPIRAGGKDALKASEIAGVLQAEQVFLWRENSTTEFVNSGVVLVDGYFGTDALSKKRTFFVTEIY